ncbi:MAG: hypothetical protein F7B17_00530 [Desulfurococcales archaeon]|nr:hypothetical protein [Desulfurococcales archaeon]
MTGGVFTSPGYWVEAFARAFVAGGRVEVLGDRWVVGMGGSVGAFEEAAERLGAREVSAGDVRWVRVWSLEDLTLVSLVGGHGYVEGVVALAASRRVKLVVGVGLCGGLSRDLDVGGLIIPYAAVREDGLTDHYVEPGYPAVAHPALATALAGHLESRGWRPRLSIVVSRSSTFTESRGWVERMAGLRVSCVDVETSTLYTLSTLAGIKAAAALIVSDSLPRGESLLGTQRLREAQARLITDTADFVQNS